MNKKDLLEIPKLRLTSGMITKAKSKEYSRFYRAIVKDGILKVAVWNFCTRTATLTAEPDYEIYVDKDNNTWENRDVSQNSWGKARIENLNMPTSYEDYYGVKGYEPQQDRKLVNKYFESDKNKTIRDVVLKFQKEIAREKLQRAHSAELSVIDAVMYQVPEEPKDFEDWIVKEAFCNSQYMLYDKAAGKSRCTSCWGIVDYKKDFRHNQEGKCPLCHSDVMYKSWNKQKVIQDNKIIGTLQRLKDDTGYVIRQWKVRIRYQKNNDYTKELFRYEYLRYEMSDDFRIGRRYEWGEYKNTRQYRWCYHINHGLSGYCSDFHLRPECILYPRNITRLLKNTELKYMPVAKLLRRKRGRYIEVDKVFGSCYRYPQIEMLLKVGLVSVAYDIIRGHDQRMQWNGESPWKYLGISKDYYKMALKKDPSIKEVQVMRIAMENHRMLNFGQIVFYAKYFNREDTRNLLELGHTDKMHRYLQELQEKSKEYLQDYIDYIHDLDYMNLPKTKAALFPKDFQAVHRQVAEMRVDKENKHEKEEIRKKNRRFQKLLPEIQELYKVEDEQFCIVIPACKKDFQLEGQLQHNCVGGTYFDKMLKRECVVVFLRQKNDPDKPYCTVEFDIRGNVRQNRAIYNRQAPPEAIEFINRVSATVKQKIMKEEAEKAMKAEKELLQVAAV